MYLIKRNCTYYLCYEHNGATKRISTKCQKKKDALLFLNSFNPESISEKQKSITLSDGLEKYLFDTESIHTKKTTQDYQSTIKQFILFCKDKPIQEITTDLIQRYLNLRLKLSQSTASKDRRYLRSMFNYFYDMGFAKTNPVTKTHPVKIDARPPAFMKEDEFLTFIKQIPGEEELKLLFIFAFYSGMRLNEILQLKFEHCDFEQNFFVVGADFKTKTNKARTLPLLPVLKNIILERYNLRNSLYVFSDKAGGRYKGDYVSKRFKKFIRSQGLSEAIHFHCLRHSSATHFLNNGLSLFHTSKLLGHSSTNLTEKIYIHTNCNDLSKAVLEILDRN